MTASLVQNSATRRTKVTVAPSQRAVLSDPGTDGLDVDDAFSDGSGIGEAVADTESFPLNHNSLHRREGPFRPRPDDFIGLPSLYVVNSGAAVASRSVIHYIDPLLLELPRLTTVLPKIEASEHMTLIAPPHQVHNDRVGT